MSQAAQKQARSNRACSHGLVKMPSGRPRSSRSQFGLTHQERQAAQVVAINSSTSKAQSWTSLLCLCECSALTPSTKVSPPITNCLRRFLQRCLNDPREALRPIVSAARDQPNALAIAFDAKPIAVIFDFIVPLRACRHGLPVGKQAELEFGHACKTGAWLEIAYM